MLSGKAIVALLAAAAVFVGAQGLVPPIASAAKVDCTFEPDQAACNDGSSGAADGAAADDGGSAADSAGASGDANVANYSWGWDPNLVPAPEAIDDPTRPDPAVQRALNGTQPILQALDPDYMDQLVKDGLVNRKLIRSTDFTEMIGVLSNDCERLSTMIGNLEHRMDVLSFALDQQDDGPGAAPFRKSLRSARSQRHERAVEYHVLECASVLSLDGRD